MNSEPWYDYLALPIAPAVLVLQFSCLFMKWRLVRCLLPLACAGSIFAMWVYVYSIPLDPSEANIGAGVLMLWFGLSLILLGVAAVRELADLIHGRFLAKKGEKSL